MKKSARWMLLYLFLCMASIVTAQPFASWTKTELKLNNGIVERIIRLPAGQGSFTTSVYKPVQGEFRYFDGNATDFSLKLTTIFIQEKANGA